MKIFTAVLIIFVLLGGIAVLPFSSLGNKLLQPFVEKKINERLPVQVSLARFDLGFKTLDLRLESGEENFLSVALHYDMFAKSFDGTYELTLLDTQKIAYEPLQKYAIKTTTKGDIQGTLEAFKLEGILALANGGGKYDLSVKNNQIETMNFSLTKMQAQNLFAMMQLPRYVNGTLNTQGTLHSKGAKVFGSVNVFASDATLNNTMFKEKYGIEFPKNGFDATLELFLDVKTHYDLKLHSSLANIDSKGSIDANKIKAFFDVDIAHLEALEPLIGHKLNGALQLSAHAEGVSDDFALHVVSSAGGGKSKYEAQIKNYTLAALKGSSQTLDLQKVLYMLDLPFFASGDLNIQADIHSFDTAPKGSVNASVANGVFNNTFMQKTYERSFGDFNAFSIKSDAQIEDDSILTNVLLDADVATVDLKKGRYDVKEKRFFSPYIVNIGDLKRLKPLAKRDLQGSFVLSGDVLHNRNSKHPVVVKGSSTSFDGLLGVDYQNSVLTLKAKEIVTQKVLDALTLERFINGKSDMNLTYDTLQKSGDFIGDFQAAKIAKSFFTDAIYNYSGVDLSARELDKGDVKAKIKNDDIAATFDLSADRVLVKSENMHLNTQTKKIKGDIALRLKEKMYNVKVNGSTDNLQEAFDYEDLLRQEVQRQIEKKAKEFIEKELGSDFLKGLFN